MGVDPKSVYTYEIARNRLIWNLKVSIDLHIFLTFRAFIEIKQDSWKMLNNILKDHIKYFNLNFAI